MTKQRAKNKSEVPLIHIPNHHEPIIDHETWNAVQQQFEERSTLKGEGRKHFKSNWFSSKVVCGVCGRPCNATNSKASRTVICTNRTKNGNIPKVVANGETIGCKNKGINEKVLAFIMSYIIGQIQSSREEIIKDLLTNIEIIQSEDTLPDTSYLESEIDNLNRKKRKAIDLMLDDQISKSDLAEQKAFYDSEIVRLTEEINQSRNLSAIHKRQIDKIKEHIAEVNKTADMNADNTEVYSEMLEKFIINEDNTIVYLKCLPFGFEVTHRVEKYGKINKFDIFIESFKILT